MASAPISANTGALLTTTNSNLYTSPAGTQSMISKFTLTNTSDNAVVVTTLLSSSNVANSTALLQVLTVPAHGTSTVQGAAQHVIPANGSILAHADQDNLVIAKLSVVQFTS